MSDIEEFLRRAAALRAQQAQKSARPGQRPNQPPRPAPPRPAVAPILEAEVIEAEEVSGDDVARLVNQHLDNRKFTERASHLAESVRNVDDVMEVHLHETFEHRLGQLGTSTSRAEDSTLDTEEAAARALPPARSTASEISQLLRSGSDLRNAIVLREILNRPEHLW